MNALTNLFTSTPNTQPRRGLGSFGVLVWSLLVYLMVSPARADESPAGCTGSGLGISLFADKLDAHVGDTVCYSAMVFNTVFPACLADQIVASVTTPDGVVHPITLTRTILNPGDSDFYTNVVCYTIRAQDVRADSTVRATAADTGRIHQNDTDSNGGGNQGVNTVVNFPCIQVSKLCAPGIGELGAITFSGSVRNCGNTFLTNVVVTDFANGGSFVVVGPITLDTNQTVNFQGSYVPINPCAPSSDTLTATARDMLPFASNVVATASSTCTNILTPGIAVSTLCPAGPVGPGQLLVFSGSVTNTGNVTLTNVTVMSDRPAPNTVVFTAATLAPGAIADFTGSYTAPTNCADPHTVTALANTLCGAPVSTVATVICPIVTSPQVSVTASCPATPPGPGGTVTYSGAVQNTGDITLTNVIVMSDRPAPSTVVFSTPSLAPGATANFSGSYAVPAGLCSVTANLSVTAKDVCTTAAVSNATAITCTVATAPNIAVTLTCPPTQVATGGLITYSGTVRNTGNVALSNIMVVNNQPAPNTVVFSVGSLAPGASTNFNATFTAPSDACSVASTVTASASDVCAATVVTANATATCPLVVTPRIVVSQSCPAVPVALGGLLTFSGTVSNAGNVTLTNVAVVNDHSGSAPVFTVATLAPGAVAAFTGSYTVPNNNACSITSTVTASANDKCAGTRVTASSAATCPVLGAPTIGVGLVCPVTATPLGAVLTYSGSVTNTGNITITNVVVTSDSPTPGTVVFRQATLTPGVVVHFTGSYTVPQTNACSTTTTVTATANDQCAGGVLSSSATITCPLITAPRIVVTQLCPPTPAVPGGLIAYSGIVSNAGNITLNNIAVVNTQSPGASVFTLATLAPGATAGFSGSIVAPLDSCSAASVLNVTAQDQCTGLTVNNSVTTSCPLVTTPQLVVTKSCPATPVTEGGQLVFTGTVTNTGNVTLNNVFVVNDRPAANTTILGPITLAPGAGTNFTGSYTAPLNTCSITDTLTARGQDKCSGLFTTNIVTATCPITTIPKISVTLACPPATAAPGALVTYLGTVKNVGNVTLNNVTVVNNLPGSSASVSPVVFSIATLPPGVTTNFNLTLTAPADSCSFTTSVTAAGSDNCSGVAASNVATATCPLATAPRIAVTESCPLVPASLGGVQTFSGTVSNAGNVTLTNVVVVDDRAGNTPVFTAATLAPGASAPFTGSFTVPLNAGCSITSVVTATGNDNCVGTKVTANATSVCPVQTAPAIFVLQFCPSTPPPPNGILNFSGIVSNSGNITLTNIQVFNDKAGSVAIFTTATLAPGASANFTGHFTVPLNCCSVSSTATAKGNDTCTGQTVTVTDTEVCPVSSSPRITITKVCPTGTLEPGDLLKYSGSVSNAGNITLTNVTVVNNVGGSTSVAGITLAPGESVTYRGSYTIPNDFCGTDTVTATGVGYCSGTTVTSSATTTCPIVTSPFIVVTKNCPLAPTPRGGLFTYTGTVSNGGNVTLTNVFVVDDAPTNNTPVLGPITLAPGASANFTGSYVAGSDWCAVLDTVTARGQDTCSGASVTATASALCPLLATPALAVAKSCPTITVSSGGLFTFTGAVTNTGDVTLTNVMVFSAQSGANVPIAGPLELAPGESHTFESTYAVQLGDAPMADIVTATGTDSCSSRTVTVRANCFGTLAQVVSPAVASVISANGMVTISWTATPGVTYTLQSKDSVTDSAWVDVPGSVTANGASASKTDAMSASKQRIYRIKVAQ